MSSSADAASDVASEAPTQVADAKKKKSKKKTTIGVTSAALVDGTVSFEIEVKAGDTEPFVALKRVSDLKLFAAEISKAFAKRDDVALPELPAFDAGTMKVADAAFLEVSKTLLEVWFEGSSSRRCLGGAS